MSQELHFSKTIFLFVEDVVQITEAITLAQRTWRNEKEGENEEWDTYCEKRINELQTVLNKIHDTPYKKLPTPNNLNKL
jgi:hypothetical protein